MHNSIESKIIHYWIVNCVAILNDELIMFYLYMMGIDIVFCINISSEKRSSEINKLFSRIE